MTKTIKRKHFDSNEVETLSFDEFLEELTYQISQSHDIALLYEEEVERNETTVSFEEYAKETQKYYIKEMQNGYCIEIMGDTYYPG